MDLLIYASDIILFQCGLQRLLIVPSHVCLSLGMFRCMYSIFVNLGNSKMYPLQGKTSILATLFIISYSEPLPSNLAIEIQNNNPLSCRRLRKISQTYQWVWMLKWHIFYVMLKLHIHQILHWTIHQILYPYFINEYVYISFFKSHDYRVSMATRLYGKLEEHNVPHLEAVFPLGKGHHVLAHLATKSI